MCGLGWSFVPVKIHLPLHLNDSLSWVGVSKNQLEGQLQEGIGEFGILPFFFKKKFGNMSLFTNYIGACPYLKTRFYQNQVMPDQT